MKNAFIFAFTLILFSIFSFTAPPIPAPEMDRNIESVTSSRLSPGIMTSGGWSKINAAWGYTQYCFIVNEDIDGHVTLTEGDFGSGAHWNSFLDDLGLPPSTGFVITDEIDGH